MKREVRILEISEIMFLKNSKVDPSRGKFYFLVYEERSENNGDKWDNVPREFQSIPLSEQVLFLTLLYRFDEIPYEVRLRGRDLQSLQFRSQRDDIMHAFKISKFYPHLKYILSLQPRVFA